MFTDKQSDIFYNDETKELFVCTVSSVSANRCEDDSTVYGALPIIYKINKNTNYKKVVYPKNLDTFTTDLSSDLFNLTTICTTLTGNNFASISKPLINFNKSTCRYSVTFLGRYESTIDGLGVNNFIFENVKDEFHLLTSNAYLPQDTLSASNIEGLFTFDSGAINSDLYIGGNTIRNDKKSWFNPDDGDIIERSPEYLVGPTYVETTSSIGFNLINDQTNTTIDTLTGDASYPLMYSGGYITINPKYAAYDPTNTIRVDFRARSFNFTDTPTAYSSTQSTGTSASRWIQQYSPAGAGEGFCVFFFQNPASGSYVVPNGIGSTLGYSKADFSSNETAGTAHETYGLWERNNWTPHHGNITVLDDKAYPAKSMLGVGFDINGHFTTTSEDKPGHFNSANTTATPSPCSVGVRGNRYYNMQSLTSVSLSNISGGTSVPLHTSAADAVFVDYRVELANAGKRLTVYHKLTSATDYNTILELRLDKIAGGNVGIGTSNPAGYYDPWKGLKSADGSLPLINVGLSFTTSNYVSRFELKSFEVNGVKVRDPWNVGSTTNKSSEESRSKDGKARIDYLSKSSANLRKRLLNADTNEDVDMELVIPSTGQLSKDLQEFNPKITLCDDNDPDVVNQDVKVKITKIPPSQIDKIIARVCEQGDTTTTFDVKTIPQEAPNEDPPTIVDEVIPKENPEWAIQKMCIWHNDELYAETDEDNVNDTVYTNSYQGVWFRLSNGKKHIWVKGYDVYKFFNAHYGDPTAPPLPSTHKDFWFHENADLIDWFTPAGIQIKDVWTHRSTGTGKTYKEWDEWRLRSVARPPENAAKMQRFVRAMIQAFGKLDRTTYKQSDDFYLNFDIDDYRSLITEWNGVRRLHDFGQDGYDNGPPVFSQNETEWVQNFVDIGFVAFNSKVLSQPTTQQGLINAKCLKTGPPEYPNGKKVEFGKGPFAFINIGEQP